MPTTDLLRQYGLSRNPFTDRTAEKTELDLTSMYIHSDLQNFSPSETTYLFFGRRGSGKTTIRLAMQRSYEEYNARQDPRQKESPLGHFLVDMCKPGHMTTCLKDFQVRVQHPLPRAAYVVTAACPAFAGFRSPGQPLLSAARRETNELCQSTHSCVLRQHCLCPGSVAGAAACARFCAFIKMLPWLVQSVHGGSNDNWDAVFVDNWTSADLVDCIYAFAINKMVSMLTSTGASLPSCQGIHTSPQNWYSWTYLCACHEPVQGRVPLFSRARDNLTQAVRMRLVQFSAPRAPRPAHAFLGPGGGNFYHLPQML